MPLINLKDQPTRLDDPSFILNHDSADPIQIRCLAKNIEHSKEQEFEDVETFCNHGGESPGTVKQSIELEVFISHGTNGLFNVLLPLEGQVVPFAYLNSGGNPVGPDNMEMSGDLYIPAVSFINAGVRKYSEQTLSFKIRGGVVFNDTTPVSSDHSGI